MSEPKKEFWYGILLAALFLAAGTVRLGKTFSLTTLTHDGSIAYCAAAGQLKAFQRCIDLDHEIYARWVTADSWRRFLYIEQPFCFAEIQSGLKKLDIHPSLYFWVLHVWMLLFGTHAWTGPLLNSLIASVSAWILYRMSYTCWGDRFLSAAIALVWYASSTVMAVSLMARQYDLMTLLGLLLVWRVVLLGQPERTVTWVDGVYVSVVTAAGLLTHFHFPLIVTGCGLYLLLSVRSVGWKRCLYGWGGMVVGGLLFWALFGNPQESFDRARLQSQPFQPDMVPVRLSLTWNTLASFFGNVWFNKVLTVCFFGGLILLPLLLMIHRYRAVLPKNVHPPQSGLPFFFFFSWTLLTTVSLYLGFVSPIHAMTSRYLCLTWPFMAAIIVWVCRWIPAYSKNGALGCALYMVIVSAIYPFDTGRAIAPRSDPIPTFQKAEAVVIDMPNRGYLFPVLYQLRDDQWVFVGHQEDILAHADQLKSKQFRTIAYYNMNTYGNTREMGEEVFRLLKEDYLLILKGTVWETGNLLFGSRSKKR